MNGGATVENCINAALSLKSLNTADVEIHLTVKDLKNSFSNAGEDKNTITPTALAELSHVPLDESLITATNVTKHGLAFKLKREQFLRETFKYQNAVKLFDEPKETIIVEFSSPNIAKPFHLGHLRSTIIGNFVANVLVAYEHRVIRINYLGDWGTQFGFLKLGMDMANLSEEEIRRNPIKHLFEAYVKANRLAEKDASFGEQARAIFGQMENGLLPDLEAWKQYRNYTVNELESVYQRLGIKFDEYAWESQYRKMNIQTSVLDKLHAMNLLQLEADGKQTFELDDGHRIALLKSDGSTLYLTRDIAAIVDRQEKYKFDRMYYVVGNEQHQHFNALFNIVRRMGLPNADRLQHIKFGRVQKMSTRKGNVVFLADLLDEIRELMRVRQEESESVYRFHLQNGFCERRKLTFHLISDTKIDLATDNSTADILGVSALIVHELQRVRTTNYAFDLDAVLSDVDSKGKSFQYTHCRLCSLEERFGLLCSNDECDPSHLTEEDALTLVTEIARFPEILYRAKQSFGPQILVNYMFALNTKISKALKTLNVKDEPIIDRRTQRILLFRMARHTLAKCMRIIGLTPLTKM